MKIRYKCTCSEEREIDVTDRVPDTDILSWMEGVVQPSISYDHSERNPNCSVRTMEYVKIPFEDENSQIGVPVVRN